MTGSRRTTAIGALGAALLLALGGGHGAAAQEATSGPAAIREAEQTPPAWAYGLAQELMSPFCPGRSLADCPSPQAESLRMWIVVQAVAGRSRDDVLNEIYARYGDVVRSAPLAEGFGTAAYVIPVAAFLAGGGLVLWFLRRWTGRPAAAPDAAALDPDLERRLDEELLR